MQRFSMLRPSLALILISSLAGCAEAASAWGQASDTVDETEKGPGASPPEQAAPEEPQGPRQVRDAPDTPPVRRAARS
jgi:hypothetical protein